MSRHEEYLRLRERGLCTACGSRPHRQNRVYCERCAEHARLVRLKFKELPEEQKQDAYTRKKLRRQLLRQEALSVLGAVCVRCGFADPRTLQLDHIHGGGTQERGGQKKWDNAYLYYRSIIHDPEAAKQKFQVLCANCNWIKRHENNENGRYYQNIAT